MHQTNPKNEWIIIELTADLFLRLAERACELIESFLRSHVLRLTELPHAKFSRNVKSTALTGYNCEISPLLAVEEKDRYRLFFALINHCQVRRQNHVLTVSVSSISILSLSISLLTSSTCRCIRKEEIRIEKNDSASTEFLISLYDTARMCY